MRNYDESDENDVESLAELNAAPWQIDLLKVNPDYTGWGPHEDYMLTKQGSASWNSAVSVETWPAFKANGWSLNNLNECVNFYFALNRESRPCATCQGEGIHPLAKPTVDAFYDFDEKGVRWCNNITEDENQALIDAGRHNVRQTAAETNALNAKPSLDSHDGINRWILVETRVKRLGLPLACEDCKGAGYIYTAPAAHVSLTLWWLHPRKGCSRGIEIQRIEQSDLPSIREFLTTAAERNAARFSRIANIPKGN
jgi:hypothetical protein